MSNTENYVSSGNEHLEMAIHLKRSADKKKAILMTMVFETKSQPTSYTSSEIIRTGDEPGIWTSFYLDNHGIWQLVCPQLALDLFSPCHIL